jgi:hypothetical protein
LSVQQIAEKKAESRKRGDETFIPSLLYKSSDQIIMEVPL